MSIEKAERKSYHFQYSNDSETINLNGVRLQT